MTLDLSEESRLTLEAIKQKGRDSWPGEEGDRRAASIEKVLARVLPEYAKALDLSQDDILAALERRRDYSAINYYQDARLPPIAGVPVYETTEAFTATIPSRKFRCPACDGISTNPNACNSGAETKDGVCDWKSYGLFGTLGKGYRVVVKATFLEHPVVHEIFMPVEFEKRETTA